MAGGLFEFGGEGLRLGAPLFWSISGSSRVVVASGGGGCMKGSLIGVLVGVGSCSSGLGGVGRHIGESGKGSEFIYVVMTSWSFLDTGVGNSSDLN